MIVKPCCYVYLQAGVAGIARLLDFSNCGFKKRSRKRSKIRDVAYREKMWDILQLMDVLTRTKHIF